MNNNQKQVQQSGFTLIELLIAVFVISILAAIAVPSYGKFMTKARRVDAISILQETAGEQIRFFSENNRYATSMSELGMSAGDTAESADGYYSVSISDADVNAYTLTAAPVEGRGQEHDTECGSFTLTASNVEDVTGTVNSAECW